MFSGSKAAAISVLCVFAAHAAQLRVCADPDNMPFSNSHEQGFENELARLMARDLGRTVHYYWIPQRGNFFKALESGLCDVSMEVPSDSKLGVPTRPYYRSSYVFVSRRNRPHIIHSIDDPSLRKLRIGVQSLGADDASIPPAHALQERGLIRNISWYPLVRTYITPNDPAELIKAVAKGNVDIAIAWGPAAGYFARSLPLTITPIAPIPGSPLRMAFDISVGVSPADKQLLARLNSVIARRQSEIRRVLGKYGVPLQ